ncbi:hypothetical protein HDU97_007902 [Phlyctochytrium planicorne]|nr:hypothetical protein HDU97_007902 [Phlyctochytrium planicorne]
MSLEVEVGLRKGGDAAINKIAEAAGPYPSSNTSSPLPSVKGQNHTIPTPNRRQRRLQFGIDCADMVHFTHWEPGGEHLKHLVVKNVVMKTQKIKYKLPQTRYFSMEFPETQTLSAGMSWTIPITFRPVAKECYSDVIEFTTSFGKFYLPIKATLPEHVLDFPDSIDFSLCPVKEIAKKTFILKNIGELASTYDWEISKPFCITPQNGTLLPGQTCSMTIEFKPQNASVYTATAVCKFGDKSHWEQSAVTQSLTVYGIGKYSHIAIEGKVTQFDFGEVFVGRSVEKKFILENHSAVPANFQIKHAENDNEPYFAFSTQSGTVSSHRQMELSASVSISGMISTEYFNITTLSGNTLQIVCTGCGVGPKVVLNTNLINFNDVIANSTVIRPLYIQNQSPVPAFYQFLSEPKSTFKIDKPWGTINPNSSVALTITFCPNEPINYYRRVYCLVEHQDGLYLDIIGTCYNEKRRPSTFHPRMIENYRKRVDNGLWSFGPEHLEEMLKSGIIRSDGGTLSYSDPKYQPSLARVLDSPYPDGSIASEYFYENTGTNLAVTLMDTYVDFGSCSRYRIIDNQTIRITNNTNGKMSCVWQIPGEEESSETVFSVSPRTVDIQPKSVTEFRVTFRPKSDNSFYGAQLECFVYFKSMRNFRLVNEDSFTPPWCLTPTVAGNTFPPGEDTFIPKINFGASRLDFPSCHVDRSVYRTVRVSNTGDTPVKFSFLEGATGVSSNSALYGIGGGTPLATEGGAPFSVKPRTGILHKNESKLIVFRFSPGEERVYEQALKCFFNSTLGNSHDLHVRGVGHIPQILFENQNTLCFRPTCLGSRSSRVFTARNTSRISVDFDWRIPKQYSSFVSIEPTKGRLSPNSKQQLVCTFSPNIMKNWILRIPCYYSHDVEDAADEKDLMLKKRRVTLTVVGNAADSRLVAQPQIVDFGAILVNTISDREITLHNTADCDVFYSLAISKVVMPEQANEITEHEIYAKQLMAQEVNEIDVHDSSEIEILQTTDVLPARSKHSLKIRACIHEQTNQMFRLYYSPKVYSDEVESTNMRKSSSKSFLKESQGTPKIRYFLCEVRALGVNPIVEVTDIRSERLEKPLLWDLFSLDRFNSLLSSVQPSHRKAASSDYEEFPIDGGILPTESPETQSLNFNFGANPIGSKTNTFHLSLMNPGVVPVAWIFYFPNDLEVEVENWADPGDYTEEQIHTNLILDNALFTIAPKSGVLNPGDSAHVILTYRHEFAGIHTLPVIFKLKNGTSGTGKEVMIYFVGYTIPEDEKCLYFHSSHHRFQPVSIGSLDPPLQTYKLYNRGSLPLEYHIENSPLRQLRDIEHSFDVFSCLNPSGCIQPGGTVTVDWIFRPLEAKEYKVDIPISINGGKTHIVTFYGEGLPSLDTESDPDLLKDSIPTIQKLLIPRQLASISLERVNFGFIPIGSQSRQITVLRNDTDDMEISFMWKIPKNLERILFVSPETGRLEKGQSRVCKFTFYPIGNLRIYDFDIPCEITNETELSHFLAWKEEQSAARQDGRSISVEISASYQKKERSKLNRTKRAKPHSGSNDRSLSYSRFKKLPSISPPKTPNSALERAETNDGRASSLSSKVLEFSLLIKVVDDEQQFAADFSGPTSFFHPRKIFYIDDQTTSTLPDHLSFDVISGITLGLLDDIVQDLRPEVLSDLQSVPYFPQLLQNPRNGIITSIEGFEESLHSSAEGETEKKNKILG